MRELDITEDGHRFIVLKAPGGGRTGYWKSERTMLKPYVVFIDGKRLESSGGLARRFGTQRTAMKAARASLSAG